MHTYKYSQSGMVEGTRCNIRCTHTSPSRVKQGRHPHRLHRSHCSPCPGTRTAWWVDVHLHKYVPVCAAHEGPSHVEWVQCIASNRQHDSICTWMATVSWQISYVVQWATNGSPQPVRDLVTIGQERQTVYVLHITEYRLWWSFTALQLTPRE